MLRLVSKGITIERLFVSRCFVKVLEKAANFMPQVNSIWFTGNSPIHSWVLRDFWGQGKMLTFVKHATHLHRWPRDFWTLYCVCQTWTGLIWQRTVLLFDFLPSNTTAREHGKELFYLQKSIWEENIDHYAVCLLLVNESTIFFKHIVRCGIQKFRCIAEQDIAPAGFWNLFLMFMSGRFPIYRIYYIYIYMRIWHMVQLGGKLLGGGEESKRK